MSIVSSEQWSETNKIYNEDPFQALALALHYSSLEGFHAFKTELEKAFKKDSDYGSTLLANVYTEFLVMFMFILTQECIGLFGKVNATKIKDKLLPYIVEYSKAYWDGDTKQVTLIIVHRANEVMAIYAKCKYLVSPLEDSYKALKDPLSVDAQFDNRLAKIFNIDVNDPLDFMMVISGSSKGRQTFFNLIDLTEWLKGPAMVLGIKNYKSIDLQPPVLKYK